MISTALVLLASYQDPQVQIKLEATTIANALETVSNSTKVNHTVKGVLSSEIVALNLKNFPLSRFRAELAKACQGKWDLEGSQYTLSLDPALAKQDKDAYTANLVTSMTSEVKALQLPASIPAASVVANEMRQLLNLQQDDPARWKLYDSIYKKRPIYGLSMQVLKSLDLSQIALLAPGQKLVYSTHPNSSQKRFPGDLSQAISAYAAQSRDWVSLSTLLPKEELETNFAYGFTSLSVVPSKVVAVVTCDYGVAEISVSGCTPLGFVLERESQVLQVPQQTMSQSDFLDETARKQSLSLTPNAQFLASHSQRGIPADNMKLARELLGSPATVDPLSFHPTEELFALAEVKGQNLIAVIPDSAFFQSESINTIGQAEMMLSESMKFESKDNLLLASPHFGWVARTERTQRANFQNFLDQLFKGEPYEIALGRYALSANDPIYSALGFRIGQLLTKRNVVPDIDFLRLIVSLPEKTLSAFKSGQPVTYASLPEVSRNMVSKILYMRQPDFVAQSNNEGEAVSPLEAIVDSSEILTKEGLQNCSITGWISTAEVLSSPELAENAFSPQQLGYLLANPTEVTQSYGNLPTKWNIAAQDDYLFEISIGSANWSLFSTVLKPAQGKPQLMTELPQRIRDEIEKARKEALEALRNTNEGGSGQRTGDPPPPPR